MITLIIGYNRPHYYKKCIEAIQQNHTEKVIISVDGEGSAAEYKKLTPHEYDFIEQPRRLGIAHHLFKMRETAFSLDDRVLIIEDDVVVSPNYTYFINNLLDWSDRHYDDVGAVSGWTKCLLSKEEKQEQKDFVVHANPHWNSYGMKRAAWRDVRKDIKEYIDKFITEGAYATRNSGAIREWARKKFAVDVEQSSNGFPKCRFNPKGLFSSPQFPSSQDAMLVGSFHRHGWKKINTVVNRCKLIGAIGEHSSQAFYTREGFGSMTIDEIKEPKEYIPV